MKFIVPCILSVLFFHLQAQQVQMLDSAHATSIRGMSVPTDKVVWLSGSKGTVARSTDGGAHFEWMTVKGYEKRDFRDIEAFDAQTAIIIAIDTPALILKTKDGGKTWKVVFEDARPGMFLDAMEFWNSLSGIVIGDPIDGKIFIIRTFDGGETWRGLPAQYYPTADPGEAMFAASGTNITKLNKQEAVFVTGGKKSRLFIRDQKIDLPVIQGSEMTGANSIAINENQHMVIVAGDYTKDTLRSGNCVITKDKGKTFITPSTPPNGYRSCVIYLSKKRLITCGLTGVDISDDGGLNWGSISTSSFHVVAKAKKGKAVFLAGSGGRVAKLNW